MNSKPTISIIIPSFNQGKYIERSILSVLNQDYIGKIELIIADGGSSDNTVDILKKYDNRIIWWSNKDKGYVDAVNKGIERSTGDIIGIQSSDDYYLKDAFTFLVEGFSENTNPSLVCGSQIRIIGKKIEIGVSFSGPLTPRTIIMGQGASQHTTFMKKEFVVKVGGLREEVDACADTDLFFRISHLQNGLYLPKYVAVYQIHKNQRTSTLKNFYDGLVRMVESCEKDPLYNNIASLSEEDKLNLYTQWKISWNGRIDKNLGKKYALENIANIDQFYPKTRNIINEFLNERTKINYIKKIKSSISDGTFFIKAKKTLRLERKFKFIYPINYDSINWWKNKT